MSGNRLFDLNCDRASKTAISRLASRHTKSLSFFEGRKTFKFCSKCNVQQASAEYILDCLGLSIEDLYDSPLLVIDFAGQQFNGTCHGFFRQLERVLRNNNR
ncbi:hypothetical protein TNCV_3380631 [Trichonephila clavipes]|nr:hypothetical protein TNCV_3380631 [Trichonephila clavipes]